MKWIHFNDVKIRNKLLMVYLVSVFLPIVLTNVIFYHVTSESVKAQKISDSELALKQISNDFRKSVEDAVGISTVLYSDSLLHQFLDTTYETSLDFILAYNFYFRDVNKYTPIYSSIRSIHLYTDNPSVITAGGIFGIDQNVKESHWYQSTSNIRQFYPVVTRTLNNQGELSNFSVVRQLDYFNQNNTQKIIMINLNDSLIEQIFHNVTFEGDIYLINKEGNIEYTTKKDVPWETEVISYESVRNIENRIELTSDYQLQYLNEWKLVGVLPENNLISDVENSRSFIFYLAIWNFVIPSMFIIYMAGNIHLRLNQIVKKMRRVKDQSFEIIEGATYKDEIGVLTSEFNRMTKKIKGLINDVYIAKIQKKDLELQKKEAQLNALQSQINPHFLFNVLETIRMRSLLKEEKETAEIIHNMAKILRNSITWDKDWITIEQELVLAKSFLEIQQYRFDDKLFYELEIEADIKHAEIPNMVIIPFIENASIHGIEAKKGKGKVVIKVEKEEQAFVFRIYDDGVGMSEEKVSQLYRSLEKDEIGDRVGIKNVYYRLKMYYGDSFSLDIKSKKNEGTMIILKLPITGDHTNSYD